MQCVADQQLNSASGCELSCSTSADCPDPKTSCHAGFCSLVGCGEGNNGNVGEGCTADTENDGTCYGAISGEGGGNLGLCVRNGTSPGPCLWPSPSSPPSLTCPAGQICGTFFDTTSYLPLSSDSFQNSSGNIPPGAYDGMCVPICSQTVKCPATMSCTLQNLGQTEFASGCTVNSGPICDPTGAGEREFEGCGQNSDCNCPLNCVTDPLYGGAVMVCEGPCLQDTDCPSAGDICVGGNCTFRLCGVLPDGGSVTGSPANAPCDALATQDGTCVPSFTGLQLSNLDICYLGGTATGACDVLARYDAGSLCTVGSFCIGGQCLQLCDPSANACPAGATCVRPNDNPTAGVCVEALAGDRRSPARASPTRRQM